MDRLEGMLSSGEKELMRLAQLICHEHRVNYYILCVKRGDKYGIFDTPKYELACYSLYPGKYLEKYRYFHKVDLSKNKKVCRK